MLKQRQSCFFMQDPVELWKLTMHERVDCMLAQVVLSAPMTPFSSHDKRDVIYGCDCFVAMNHMWPHAATEAHLKGDSVVKDRFDSK
jgi:hypothetical protein